MILKSIEYLTAIFQESIGSVATSDSIDLDESVNLPPNIPQPSPNQNHT